MGSWGHGLFDSDNAAEGLDKFITNVRERNRPITDAKTLVKVFEDTLRALNHDKIVTRAEVDETGRFAEAILAIGEHLRLYGVTVAGPLKGWMKYALQSELENVKSYRDPRKRRGVLNQFALRIGL